MTGKNGIGINYICIIAAGVMWGIIGIFVRYFSGVGLSPMQMVAARAYVSAALLVAFLLITNRSLLKIRLRDIWYFIGTGIISFVLFNFCYFTAIGMASLSVAAVLLYTAPIFVTLMSALFFKEKLTGRKAAALALAFFGCVLVTGVLGGANAAAGAGIFFGVASGFLYALYSIFGRVALKRYHPLTVTAYTFIFASIGVTPLAGLGDAGAVSAGASLLPLLLLFGVISGLLPYALYTKGLSGVEPGRASIMASVEPVVATLTGVVCFGEALEPAGIAGIAALVIALVVLNTGKAFKNTDKCG